NAAVLRAPSSLATRFRRSGSRAARMTSAPSARASRAVSRPMPEVPPITTTIWPASCGFIGRSGPDSLRKLRPGLVRDHVFGVPGGPVRVGLAGPLLVLAVGGLRAPHRGREVGRVRERRRAGIQAPGKPIGDLLKEPVVAVRIAERGERAIGVVLRIDA